MTSMLGSRIWAIPGGHIPLKSSGHEPECTSYDMLCILNAADEDAKIKFTLYYSDKDPVGPYSIVVGSRRVRHIRINDLIDPEAVPLDTDYGIVVESSVPIVLQFQRQDTSENKKEVAFLVAYPLKC